MFFADVVLNVTHSFWPQFRLPVKLGEIFIVHNLQNTDLDDSEPEPFADDDDGDNDPDFSPTTGDHAQLSDDDVEDGVDDDVGPRAEDNPASPQTPVAQYHVNLEAALGVDGDNTLNCNSDSQLSKHSVLVF
jgi:hypothetical protein